jgi:putative tryptophan/tyrosine transport system substrate-binding protein
MRLLSFVALALFSLLAWSQPQAKIVRIGFIGPSVSGDDPRVENLRQLREGLRELGYVEGRNLTIEWRLAETFERYPSLVAELIRLNVDVIVTPNTPGALAAKHATNTIPIVFTAIADPVGSGLVSSLARPGGNLTGLSNLMPDVSAKRLQLLKNTFPKVTRVALLFNGSNPGNARTEAELQETGAALKVKLQSLDVRSPDQLRRALDELTREHADALLVLQDPLLLNQRVPIAQFALKHRLPTMYDAREFVDVGGLMSYGPSRSDLFRRVGSYIDRILRGAKPGDLPVELPSKFELILNARTARALGVTIPQALRTQADQIID